ncbi:mitochondrial ribosomal protein L17 [Auriscalpium vulgare]|uniref:Mitochondrial ribosomal protein L17 n=1 Tax=Auriscalpium vulgare TaxID=40419 RepID=A0ACB8S5M6_9AGAM|nr:mitochondrial ribosomal protein L17 [Auriscalpium vulgare]
MKHGVAFRKFSRTSSHRMLMLRNLVTSLIEHEQIKTTLPKARDTARLAEKIISLGKKGDLPAYQRASGFLLRPTLTPKIFDTLAKRYAERPGGYTRIHKFGNRQGDNAPHAILELVDNPRDLKFEMTARSVGWELLASKLKTKPASVLVKEGVTGVDAVVTREQKLKPQELGELRPTTRWNLQKVLKYRSSKAVEDLGKKALDHMDGLLAKPLAVKALREKLQKEHVEEEQLYFRDVKDMKLKAGEIAPGSTQSALQTAQGALGWTPGRKVRWFERRKLGIDRSLTWEQV